MKSRKDLILKEFKRGVVLNISALEDKLGISRQAIHRYLNTFIREGLILKMGSGKRNATYILNSAASQAKRLLHSMESFRRVTLDFMIKRALGA